MRFGVEFNCGEERERLLVDLLFAESVPGLPFDVVVGTTVVAIVAFGAVSGDFLTLCSPVTTRPQWAEVMILPANVSCG